MPVPSRIFSPLVSGAVEEVRLRGRDICQLGCTLLRAAKVGLANRAV